MGNFNPDPDKRMSHVPASIERRIDTDPNRRVEQLVNGVAVAMKNAVAEINTVIERDPEVMDDDKLRKVEFYLETQVMETVRAIALAMTKKPTLGSGFSFDLEIPADEPQTFAPTGARTFTRMPSARPTPQPGVRYEGRLVGTKEPVPASIPETKTRSELQLESGEVPDKTGFVDAGFIDD